MTAKLNHPGQLTKGHLKNWFVVVNQLRHKNEGYLIIYSKENLFNAAGELEVSPTNIVYDEWLLTLESVTHVIVEDYGVVWF